MQYVPIQLRYVHIAKALGEEWRSVLKSSLLLGLQTLGPNCYGKWQLCIVALSKDDDIGNLYRNVWCLQLD